MEPLHPWSRSPAFSRLFGTWHHESIHKKCSLRPAKRGALLGNGLVATAVSGTAFVIAIFAVDLIFRLRIPLGVAAGVCCADLILMRITELVMFGFGAIDRMKENAMQAVISSALRLAAIAILLPFGHRVTLLWWTWAYFLATRPGLRTRCGAPMTPGVGRSSSYPVLLRTAERVSTSVLERQQLPSTTTSIRSCLARSHLLRLASTPPRTALSTSA